MCNVLKKIFKVKDKYKVVFHVNNVSSNLVLKEIKLQEELEEFYYKNRIDEIAENIGVKIYDYILHKDYNEGILYFYTYDNLKKDLFLKALIQDLNIVVDSFTIVFKKDRD